MSLSTRFHFLQMILFLGILTTRARAADRIIYLPPEDNGITITESFEYQIFDDGSLRIGTRKISPQDLQLTLPPDQASVNTPSLQVTWPTNVFSRGEISILDNLDRAVWAKKFEFNQRSNIPRKLMINGSSGLVNALMRTSLFRFCAGTQSETIELKVCTNEMSLSRTQGQFALTASSDKQESQVLFNSRPAGTAGIVPLENKAESIRVEIRSKALRAEGFLRRPLFDFYNVKKENADGYIVSVDNADPEFPKEHDKLGKENWNLHLADKKSRVYLYDDSQIPLTVDFGFKKANWPKDDININNTQHRRTYFSETHLSGEGIDENLTLLPGDNAKNPVPVQWNGQTLKGRYYATPYKSFIADAGLLFPIHLRGVYLQAHAQKWFYPLLGLETNIEPRLYHKSRDTSYDLYTLSTLHRWNGFMFQQPGMGAKLDLAYLTVNTTSFTMPGAGIFIHQRGPKLPIHIYDWHEVSVDYFPNQTSGDYKISNFIIGRMDFYRFQDNDTRYFKLSIGGRNFSYSTALDTSRTLDVLESFVNLNYGYYF